MPEPAQLFEPDPDYVPSEEVAKVAAGLLRRHDRFEYIRDLRIAYLERVGERAGEGEDAWAKCQKASPIWRDIAGVDVVIWVWSEVWEDLEPRDREALVAHELCHVDRNASGGVKLRKHDLEEFAWVVAQYGPWKDDVAYFGQQLRRWEIADTHKPEGPEPIRLPAGRERRRPGTRKPASGEPPVVHP